MNNYNEYFGIKKNCHGNTHAVTQTQTSAYTHKQANGSFCEPKPDQQQ